MVDTLGETVSGRERDLWIEITDSQLKFEPYRLDSYNPPDNRITFEVVSYSASLHPAALNFQLLPILVHGGVPLSTFECLLKDDLMSKVGALNDVLESGLKIRKWIQDTNPVAWERAQSNGIPMLGGLPNSRPEKIIWFVEVW